MKTLQTNIARYGRDEKMPSVGFECEGSQLKDETKVAKMRLVKVGPVKRDLAIGFITTRSLVCREETWEVRPI